MIEKDISDIIDKKNFREYQKVEAVEEGIKISGVESFDIKATFECGQCFRWNLQEDGSYIGVFRNNVVTVKSEDDKVFVTPCTLNEFYDIWEDYFDFKRNYREIREKLSKDDQVMLKASSFGKGIRLLQQDVWETILSFIISQNSNIPRIKKCIENICENFGDSLGNYRGREYFTIPDAERLANLSRKDLEICKLGYRDIYVLETAAKVAVDGSEKLLELRKKSFKEAEAYLKSLKGVGPKVANCILLFGLLKYESFPIDVWMKRVMAELYGFEEGNLSGMKEYAEKNFGNNSGFAQQYLFYFAREKSGSKNFNNGKF